MPDLSVHFHSSPQPEILHYFQSHLGGNIHLTFGPEIPVPARYEILIAGRPTREQLEASPSLRYLVIPFAGAPASTCKLLREFPGIAVHNLHHNAWLTAEMAITLMLAAAKFILPADRALRQNDWRPRYQPLPAVSLNGKNALILGFGAVGQRVGLVCHALGMQIRAIRRNPQKPVFNSYPVEIGGPDALPAWIPSADVLLITLPATPQTENLIGEKEIRRLPGGAILVNVGRGAIVDQHALYVALKDGHLRAAGLDVWYNYPQQETDRANTPPAEFPFHELDNVVMSPHRAGASVDTEILRMTHLANLLNTIAEGKPVPNRVDLEAGY